MYCVLLSVDGISCRFSFSGLINFVVFRHVSSNDRTGKRYRNTKPVFSIEDDDDDDDDKGLHFVNKMMFENK